MDQGLWQGSANQAQYENPACANDARSFRTCMDENQGNISICGWYLDQLVRTPYLFRGRYLGSGLLLTTEQKACQAAAKPY